MISYIETGLSRIDSQHKFLVSLYQETLTILNEGDMTEELFRQFLGTLKGYIVIHFGTELRLFNSLSEVQAQEHNVEHEKFCIWLENTMFEYFVDSTTNGREHEILMYIHAWFSMHFNTFDRDLVEYLQGL